MKHLKVKLSAVAIVLGISGAFATLKPHALTDQKWSRDPISGAYTNITGLQLGTDYQCTTASSVCTATYPASQDPNSNPASPLSVENGVFSN